MTVGKEIRLKRLIRNNRTIIVPVEGYYRELEDPSFVVREIVKGGADGILLRRGSVLRTYNLFAGRLSLVYRVSGATGTSGDLGDQRLLSSVVEAIKFGADAVVYTIILGHPKENDMFQARGGGR